MLIWSIMPIYSWPFSNQLSPENTPLRWRHYTLWRKQLIQSRQKTSNVFVKSNFKRQFIGNNNIKKVLWSAIVIFFYLRLTDVFWRPHGNFCRWPTAPTLPTYVRQLNCTGSSFNWHTFSCLHIFACHRLKSTISSLL